MKRETVKSISLKFASGSGIQLGVWTYTDDNISLLGNTLPIFVHFSRIGMFQAIISWLAIMWLMEIISCWGSNISPEVSLQPMKSWGSGYASLPACTESSFLKPLHMSQDTKASLHKDLCAEMWTSHKGWCTETLKNCCSPLFPTQAAVTHKRQAQEGPLEHRPPKEWSKHPMLVIFTGERVSALVNWALSRAAVLVQSNMASRLGKWNGLYRMRGLSPQRSIGEIFTGRVPVLRIVNTEDLVILLQITCTSNGKQGHMDISRWKSHFIKHFFLQEKYYTYF